jgi:choline-glycine betaine transporter
MLLAGGSEPAEALNGLKNITIVSALPFVIVMLLLCVAIWRDLSKDPLIIQGRLATILLEESVATAIDEHDGPFELSTNIVAETEEDGEGDEDDEPAEASAESDDEPAEAGETDRVDEPAQASRE